MYRLQCKSNSLGINYDDNEKNLKKAGFESLSETYINFCSHLLLWEKVANHRQMWFVAVSCGSRMGLVEFSCPLCKTTSHLHLNCTHTL